ncbi:MAG: hypothetical protein JXO51_09455 [Candidatus Aminicenantes bacterium]|nr:hypothetical protein [Candidatus Aminicenantes bacterium]
MKAKKGSLILALFGLIILLGLALAAEPAKKITAVKIKPDIVLRELKLTRLSGDAAGERIRIRAVVFNPVAMTSTGPFQVRASVRLPSGLYFRIGEETVSGLTYTGATAKIPSRTVDFPYDVLPGHTYHFLVTADVPSQVAERSEDNNRQEADYRMASGGFPDAGGDEVVVGGVDLVVSRVEITRGTFAGREKIQIVPTIRNMWHGGTAERIKILFDGLGLAEWVEGGIGGDETKRAGAVYVECDAALSLPLNFSVVVDSDDAIVETNDLNNRCGPVRFAAGDTHVVHECPIRGPHEPLI